MFEGDLNSRNNIFPEGPICNIEGKEVPPFVTCSPSGGITSEILTNSLKHIDNYLNFDRSVATLSLQIDGHASRFDERFLSYINPVDNKDGKNGM